MRRAEQQQKAGRHQDPVQRQKRASDVAEQVATPGALEVADLAVRSPLMQGSAALAERVGGSPRVTAQAQSFQRVGASPVMQAKFAPVQRVEEEAPLQAKLAPAQRVEEDELLQGRFAPVQRVEEEALLQGKFATAQRAEDEELLQGKFSTPVVQRQENAAAPSSSGLPGNLRQGIEALSGLPMDHVRVHYNSAEPAQLQAHAFAQGSDIHLAPGQEKHLPHEAWHVVQQAQGRVQPTTQMKGAVPVNDDSGLEHEADVMGAKALATTAAPSFQPSATAGGANAVQRVGDETETPAATKADDALKDSQQAEAEQSAPVANAPADAEKADQPIVPMEEPEHAVQVSPKADLSPHERKTLTNQGGKVIDKVMDAGAAGNAMKFTIENMTKSGDQISEGLKVTGVLESVLGWLGATAAKAVALLAAPLYTMSTALLSAKEKYSQWGAYQEATKTGVAEAAYGEKKAKHGFFAMAGRTFNAFVDFVANLLILIPGAQIVGGPMKLYASIANFTTNLVSSIMKFFGSDRNKNANSTSLLNSAINDGANNESAKLVFNLKLDSFNASVTAVFFRAKAGIKGFFGRMFDGDKKLPTFLERNGEPKDAEEMRQGLIALRKEGGDEALAPIRDEIKKSMTGSTAS